MSNKRKKQLRRALQAGQPEDHCVQSIYHPEHKMATFCVNRGKYLLKYAEYAVGMLYCHQHIDEAVKSYRGFGKEPFVEVIPSLQVMK